VSVSPFRKSHDEEDRQSLWQRMTQPSKREVKDAEDVVGLSRALLAWADSPYHAKFMEWLSAESGKPVEMKDQFKMIADTARSNAFKEIAQHIRRETQLAAAAVGEMDG